MSQPGGCSSPGNEYVVRTVNGVRGHCWADRLDLLGGGGLTQYFPGVQGCRMSTCGTAGGHRASWTLMPAQGAVPRLVISGCTSFVSQRAIQPANIQ